MNNLKEAHSLGPWVTAYHEPGNDVQHGLAGYSVVSGTGEGVAFNVHSEANARLIAAAPQMLEALMLAIKYLQHPDVQAIPFALPASNAVRSINAAIRAAEGEKP